MRDMFNSQIEQARSNAPAWWVVFSRELTDLWIGGKALNLVLIYCILLGVWVFALASDSELSMIPPREMVFETLKASLAVSLFICLIIGIDSISGERDRMTLEGLLLTPASRRQIAFGKFLATVSPWPFTFVITIPYLHVLSQGEAVFGQAVLWGAMLGSLLAPALAALGMFVSLRSISTRTSMLVGLGLYLFLLIPTQLPGSAQTGAVGLFIQKATPLTASSHFLGKIMITNRAVDEMLPWLISPFLFLALIIGLLFAYSGGLRLGVGGSSRWHLLWRRMIGISATIFAIALLTSQAMAFNPQSIPEGKAATESMQMSTDLAYKVVNAGDPVRFNTVVTNNGMENSPPLVLAMNIINLDASGEVVDPEDWSPQRTQYLNSLAAGKSATLSWRVNSLLDGDYMIYMVAIPQPDRLNGTSRPVASTGIHLTVNPFTRLNPGGVLPYAVGGPVILLLGMIFLHWLRHRELNSGVSRQTI